MKFALVFAAVLGISVAQFTGFGTQSHFSRPAPVPAAKPVARSDHAAKLLRYDNEAYPDGSYRYNVQIDNSIAAEAQGTPRDFGGNPPVIPVVSRGCFSWTSPEGQLISVTYNADENGYQPYSKIIYSPGAPPPIRGASVGTTINSDLQQYQSMNKYGKIIYSPCAPPPIRGASVPSIKTGLEQYQSMNKNGKIMYSPLPRQYSPDASRINTGQGASDIGRSISSGLRGSGYSLNDPYVKYHIFIYKEIIKDKM